MKAKPKPAVPESKPEQEHGVELACYNNLPYQHPMMMCLCGFATQCWGNWEDAGAEFDEHMAKVTS